MNSLALTPRQPQNAMWSILRAHKFYVVFNLIWNGIISVFGTIITVSGIATGDVGDMLLMGGFMSLFVLAGAWIFFDLMRKIIRDRWLLTYGVLSQGKITGQDTRSTASQNGKPATRILWSFEDHLGQTQEGKMETFDDQLIQDFPKDTLVDVFFDPTDPTRSSLPGLLRAKFKPSAPRA